MITNPVSPNGEPASLAITDLWQELSPEHQNIILQIAQAFAKQDRPSESLGVTDQANQSEQETRRQNAIAWLQERIDEAKQATPEELAQGQAELEDFQRSLNENRAPLPPLFP